MPTPPAATDDLGCIDGTAVGVNQNRRLTRCRLRSPAMRMFGLVADWWGLCNDQRRLLLGSPPTTLYEEWVRLAVDHGDPGLTEDALAAITNLLAIQMSLRQRLGSDLDVSRWLRTSNPVAPFSGQLPLDTILAASPGELARIHGILAAEAGPRQSPGTDIELF